MCVYKFGGLIDRCSALGVVYNVSLGSHSDTCMMGGECVCRHLTSAWVASSVGSVRLI